jgi:DNA (cytosine-5)-methyltransferase 1
MVMAIESHPKDSRYQIITPETNQCIPSIMCHDAAHGGLIMDSVVRRLTPMECERLQGYPDGWTDIGEWTDTKGKKHKDADSPRYKALGNSIALPFWEWMAYRMCEQYDHPIEIASLFDGIGGFPLVFSRCGATPVWASEIEEFPIAVTKKHFPEGEEDE